LSPTSTRTSPRATVRRRPRAAMRAICALVNVGSNRSICEGPVDTSGTSGSGAFTGHLPKSRHPRLGVAQSASPVSESNATPTKLAPCCPVFASDSAMTERLVDPRDVEQHRVRRWRSERHGPWRSACLRGVHQPEVRRRTEQDPEPALRLNRAAVQDRPAMNMVQTRAAPASLMRSILPTTYLQRLRRLSDRHVQGVAKEFATEKAEVPQTMTRSSPCFRSR
jgi:hypothetical protein